MKTHKFIYSFFFCLATMICQAHVFPESDAVWNIQIDGKEYYYGLSGETIMNDTDSYFGEKSCWSYKARIYTEMDFFHVGLSTDYLQGDTIINLVHYRKFYGSDPFLAIRQENQKVYAFDNCLQQEYLVYDFGVNEGDVIYSEAPSGYISREPVVTKVDSVWLYNGEHRKRIRIEGDEWIEGIGSINGFNFPVREFVTCDCNSSYQLIAFAKEDVVSFFDQEWAPWYGYCGNIVDVFPRTDAIWNIQIDGKEHYYGLSGDTIISGKPYSKLYLLNDTTLIIDSGDAYMGGFRQEEKKVWFRPSFPPSYHMDDYTSYPEETVLYDFSKNAGDTIWHNVVPDLDIYYWDMQDSISASIITSIDMDEWGRKIYHTSQYLILQEEEFIPIGRHDRWEEGIGSMDHGLFWFLSQITVGGFPQFHLACFKQGNEVKYMNNAKYNSCFCWSSGISEKNRIPLAVVYENNSIRIKGEAPVFPCDFRLFSPTGQLILEQRLQSDEIIPFNQKGIWLYQVQKNEEVVRTGKIMIK